MFGPAYFLTAQRQLSPNPGPQIFQDRLKITVTGLKKVQKWEPFPNSIEITPKEGQDLIIVSPKIKNTRTGEEDTVDKRVPLAIDELKGFELEDTQGDRYVIETKTNLREVPFIIPKGTKLKLFRILRLTFDIESLVKNIDKPEPH